MEETKNFPYPSLTVSGHVNIRQEDPDWIKKYELTFSVKVFKASILMRVHVEHFVKKQKSKFFKQWTICVSILKFVDLCNLTDCSWF